MDDKVSNFCNNQITAACHEFCPKQERTERQRQRRVHYLEREIGTDNNRRGSFQTYMVKEYSRPAAGKQTSNPQDLRPPDVLLKVTKYLINSVMARDDFPWFKLYSFTFDRMRAVRQDLTIQRASCDITVVVLEVIARFHVFASYRLCEEPIANFDPKINHDHANECLYTLLHLFRTEHPESPNRGTMEALYIVFNLGSMEALHNALLLPPKIRSHEQVALAFKISTNFQQNNFIRLRRLSQKCDVILSSALHLHLPHIRRQALSAINASFAGRNLFLSVQILQKWLMFDDVKDATDYCLSCCLIVNEKGVLCMRKPIETPTKREWPSKRSTFLVGQKMTSAPEEDVMGEAIFNGLLDTSFR